MPKWYELLLDHNLIKDIDEWKQILAGLDLIPASDYNLLRDGITFTVLKPADLIYRDDRKEFSRYVKFEEEIPGITYYTARGNTFYSYLSISHAGLGYELRISAQDSLQHLERDEKDHVRAAFLPREAFCFYWEDKGKFSERHWKRLRATQEKLMEKNGWEEIEETKPYYIAEIPTHIEHKYFTVWHKRI